jgi:hypothetical protein
MSLTQENAVDLHSLGRVFLHLRWRLGGGGEYRSCQKHDSMSLHDLVRCRYLLDVSFITSLKSNLCTALTTRNTTENITVFISHAQNTTALQPNLFLTGIHQLLVTNKGPSPFLSAKNCQGQLQTPQSVSVIHLLPLHAFMAWRGTALLL